MKINHTSVLVSILFSSIWPCFGEPLSYSIYTDKNIYVLGEPVEVTFSLKNNGSNNLKVEKWCGPFIGACSSNFAIFYQNTTQEQIRYVGKCAHCVKHYFSIPGGRAWKQAYVINDFLYPSYVLQKPGTYIIKSSYFSAPDDSNNRDAFKGIIDANIIKIEVIKKSLSDLQRLVADANTPDSLKIAVLGMHRDPNTIPLLAMFCVDPNADNRKRAHKALSLIGTDNAVIELGKSALHEPDWMERVEITRILAKLDNVKAIPYLNELLKDPYTGTIGQDGKTYRQYTVRIWAAQALNQLGVTTKIPELEEIRSQTELMPEYSKEKLEADILCKNGKVRFEAVQKLAISGYSKWAASLLIRVACDPNISDTTRDYAAMGLGNYTNSIPTDDISIFSARLKLIVEKEKGATPDGIIRLLIQWGAAAYIYQSLGEDLKNHKMEISVLECVETAGASERLLQIYQQYASPRTVDEYSKAISVGSALANKGDLRGADILISLIQQNTVAPSLEYRRNLYDFLTLRIEFSPEIQAPFREKRKIELDNAVLELASWWQENRNKCKLRELSHCGQDMAAGSGNF